MLNSYLPKIQPHDLEAERAVLGSVLLSPTVLTRAQEFLTRDDFYHGPHRVIFDALTDLAEQSEGIDLVTLSDRIESKGQLEKVGGRGTLAELLTTVGSAANIEHHARIVRDSAIRRSLIRFATDITQGAYDKAPTLDLLQDAERKLFQISAGRDERTWCSLAEVSREPAFFAQSSRPEGMHINGRSHSMQPNPQLASGHFQRNDPNSVSCSSRGKC